FAGRDVPGSAWEEPERDEHQLVQGAAHPRYAIRTRPAFIRTRGGCSYHGFVPVGAPPPVRTGRAQFRTQRVLLQRFRSRRSTALGVNRASTYSHPGRVLLPRFRSCRSTALGANRGKHIFAPGAGAPTPIPLP